MNKKIKNLLLIKFLLIITFAGSATAQQKTVEVKIPRGKTSTTISGTTKADNETIYNIGSVRAGQVITITVNPSNLVIGFWVDYVEADAKKGKFIYKVSKSQDKFDFQFVIGNARAGTKYKAVVQIK